MIKDIVDNKDFYTSELVMLFSAIVCVVSIILLLKYRKKHENECLEQPSKLTSGAILLVNVTTYFIVIGLGLIAAVSAFGVVEEIVRRFIWNCLN